LRSSSIGGRNTQFRWLEPLISNCPDCRILLLRKQLAFYQEHEIRPRRLTNGAGLWLFSGRASLLGDVLLVIEPATLIDWRRKAFQLFWK